MKITYNIQQGHDTTSTLSLVGSIGLNMAVAEARSPYKHTFLQRLRIACPPSEVDWVKVDA